MTQTNRKYSTIVVDPPWAYGTKARGSAAKHYGTVGKSYGEGVDEIATVAPVNEWAADNAHLYMWVTNPKMPFAFRLLDLWGFEYKTMLTWVKTNQDGSVWQAGMGFYFRGVTEHVLFAVKGDKPIPAAIRRPNVFLAPRGEHSEKPEAFYALVESVSPGEQRLDVFCRKRRQGWDVWGNEAEQHYQARLFDEGAA